MRARNVVPFVAAVFGVAADACSDATTAAKAPLPTLAQVSPFTQQGTVNQLVASKPTVRVTDASGQPVAGLNIIFSFQGLDFQPVVTGADGTASTEWRLARVAGTQVLIARLYSAKLVQLGPFITFQANALPDSLAAIQSYSFPVQLGFPSTAVLIPPVLFATDQYFNGKPGVEVTFEVTGGGSVNPAKVTTDSTGRASVSTWTLGTAIGTDTLIARAPNVPPVYLTVGVTQPFVVSSIVTGYQHTCAISNGDVYCWGQNALGQVKPNDPSRYWMLPQLVPLGVKVTALSSENDHTCAISNENPPQGYCWGDNSSGQLGVVVPGSGPVRVAVADGLASVTAGSSHTCGLTPAGVAYCWGDDSYGQLGTGGIFSCFITGDGVVSTCPGPQPVKTDLRFASLAAGISHTCGLVGAQMYCWGLDDGGQLGSSAARLCTEQDYYYGTYSVPCAVLPQVVSGAPGFAAIAAGYETCALAVDGSVNCFASPMGRVVLPNTTVVKTLSSDGSCGLGGDGQAFCWISGFDAQSASFSRPVPLDSGTAFAAITQAAQHRCGILKSNGAAVCWGNNDAGQLGNGTTGGSVIPLPVVSPRPSNP
jgi:alpha-tubulin suppressor-like RCC1 family protein